MGIQQAVLTIFIATVITYLSDPFIDWLTVGKGLEGYVVFVLLVVFCGTNILYLHGVSFEGKSTLLEGMKHGAFYSLYTFIGYVIGTRLAYWANN